MTDSPPSAGYALAVDLGTTWTAAAVLRGDTVEPATLGVHETLVPSLLHFGPDGSILHGHDAARRAAAAAGGLARGFKRRLGDRIPMVIGGRQLRAEELMGILLSRILATAEEREGALPDRLVLTHPANWTDEHHRLA